MWSSTVNSLNKIFSWWQTPIFWIKYFLSLNIDIPFNNISPSFGSSIPEIILIKVVFPAPLWPNKQNISPGNKSHEKLSIALKSPYSLVIFLMFK